MKLTLRQALVKTLLPVTMAALHVDVRFKTARFILLFSYYVQADLSSPLRFL